MFIAEAEADLRHPLIEDIKRKDLVAPVAFGNKQVCGSAFPPDPKQHPKLQTSALLPRFLTPDAVPRPWNGFQPFHFYVAAALGAFAESPLPHPLQSLGEVFQHLLGGCRLVDQSLPFVLARRLIRRVGMLDRTFPRLVLCGGERMIRFRNAGFENPLEFLALGCWQHALILDPPS